MHLDDLEPLADGVEDELDAIVGEVDDQLDAERVVVAVQDLDALDAPHQTLDRGYRMTKVHSWKENNVTRKYEAR